MPTTGRPPRQPRRKDCSMPVLSCRGHDAALNLIGCWRRATPSTTASSARVAPLSHGRASRSCAQVSGRRRAPCSPGCERSTARAPRRQRRTLPCLPRTSRSSTVAPRPMTRPCSTCCRSTRRFPTSTTYRPMMRSERRHPSGEIRCLNAPSQQHRARRVRRASAAVQGSTSAGFDVVASMVHRFWETGEVEPEWETGLLAILAKKGDLSDPGNYRGIMMLEVAYKILANLLHARLEPIMESLDHESQCGFRRRRGCSDAIFTIQELIAKRREHGLETWVLFIDLVKAFDRVPRELLWDVLRKYGVPVRIVDLLIALHK
eukprot:2488683-Prymnesium_polylepis.1